MSGDVVEQAAEVMCRAAHVPPVPVAFHEDPRCRVAACFGCQRAAAALRDAGLLDQGAQEAVERVETLLPEFFDDGWERALFVRKLRAALAGDQP